jgi:hypothetical protein
MEAEVNPEVDKIVSGNTALNQVVEEQRAMMAGGGAPPAGGMPAGPPAADPVAQIMAKIQAFGNPQVPVTPVEMQQVAEEAAAMFAFMPETEKRAKLREVEQLHGVMADMIRTEMKKIHAQRRKDYVIQGQQMEQQGGGQPMPPM